MGSLRGNRSASFPACYDLSHKEKGRRRIEGVLFAKPLGEYALSVTPSARCMPRSLFAHRKSVFLSIFCLLGVLLVGSGCDMAGSNDSGVTVSGRVVNTATMNPVEGVVVTIRYSEDGEEEETTVTTDEMGQFSTSLDISTSVEVSFATSKGGVSDQTTERISTDLEEVDGIQLELALGEDEEAEPGKPTNITLSDQSADVIRVQESGGEEVTRLTFQVVDSTGTPIGIDQAVDVNFRFGKQPGDASLTPETVTTDGEGTATVNVASGKTAGVIQVVAETEKADGTPIRSKPVSVTVHGGLPNKCHFTVTAAQSNFAGLDNYGETNTITAILGDKYGNPVIPGTSVSFSTNTGIIEGSMQTGDEGTGSVTLTSAQPQPSDGVGAIRAETVGTDDVNTIVDPNHCPDPAQTGNENRIIETVPVVLSGRPEVIVDPDSAVMGETYQLTVWDVENNNPLAPGTSISVEAEGTKVQAIGHTDVTLDDTSIRDENGDGFGAEDVEKGEGLTEFTFRVVEDNSNENEGGTPSVESITISISGPNRDLDVVLTPTGRGVTAKSRQTVEASDGATIQTTPSGSAVIRAPETE